MTRPPSSCAWPLRDSRRRGGCRRRAASTPIASFGWCTTPRAAIASRATASFETSADGAISTSVRFTMLIVQASSSSRHLVNSSRARGWCADKARFSPSIGVACGENRLCADGRTRHLDARAGARNHISHGWTRCGVDEHAAQVLLKRLVRSGRACCELVSYVLWDVSDCDCDGHAVNIAALQLFRRQPAT